MKHNCESNHTVQHYLFISLKYNDLQAHSLVLYYSCIVSPVMEELSL